MPTIDQFLSSLRADKQIRETEAWAAVFGAHVSAQVTELFRRGLGAPENDEDWETIADEAASVADCAMEAAERLKARGEWAPLSKHTEAK